MERKLYRLAELFTFLLFISLLLCDTLLDNYKVIYYFYYSINQGAL